MLATIRDLEESVLVPDDLERAARNPNLAGTLHTKKVADLARYCGLRKCRYRGLGRAGIHTLLAATVCNIKRMVKLLCGKPVNYFLESSVAI